MDSYFEQIFQQAKCIKANMLLIENQITSQISQFSNEIQQKDAQNNQLLDQSSQILTAVRIQDLQNLLALLNKEAQQLFQLNCALKNVVSANNSSFYKVLQANLEYQESYSSNQKVVVIEEEENDPKQYKNCDNAHAIQGRINQNEEKKIVADHQNNFSYQDFKIEKPNVVSQKGDIITIDSDSEEEYIDQLKYQQQVINNGSLNQSKYQSQSDLQILCQDQELFQIQKEKQFRLAQEKQNKYRSQQISTVVYIGVGYQFENNSVYFYKIQSKKLNNSESFKFQFFEEDFNQEKMFDILILMLKKVSQNEIYNINLKFAEGQQSHILKKIFEQNTPYKKQIYNIKKQEVQQIIKDNKIKLTCDQSKIKQEEIKEIYFTGLQEINKWPTEIQQYQVIQVDEDEESNDNFIITSAQTQHQVYLEGAKQEYEICLKKGLKIPSNNPYYLLYHNKLQQSYDFLDSSPGSTQNSQNSTPLKKQYSIKRKYNKEYRFENQEEQDGISDYERQYNYKPDSYKKIKKN